MNAPQNTRASVILADYIGLDAAGKVNALGQGFTVTGVTPTGATPPMYVAALIDMPSASAGDQVALTLELRDESTDTLVTMPDEVGSANAVRIQQLVPVQRTQIPGVHLPNDLPCRVQTVLAFPMGLPLTPGHRFAWKLEVDGTRLKGWSAHFYVVAPPPGPVIGGPAGPSTIPNIQSPPVEQDDEQDRSPGN